MVFFCRFLLFCKELEDQPAFGRLTSSSCGGLGDRRDPDTSDVSPRACGARLGLEIPLFPPQLGKYSLERLLQKYFIQDQNLFRSKGVPVQEVAIPPVVDGPGGESHPKREHFCSHQDPVDN